MPFKYAPPELYQLCSDLFEKINGQKLKTEDPRFTIMPPLSGCGRCGQTNHSTKKCEVAEVNCDYCDDSSHALLVCHKLHVVCQVCLVRGHNMGLECPETKEQREAYRSKWEKYTDFGLRTRERWGRVEFGYFYFD